MNGLIPFDFEGRAVRVAHDEDGVPWFVARDVCECLEIRNSRDAVERLDNDERSDVGINDTRSKGGCTQSRTMQAVNEPGVYRLAFTSRKEAARRFTRWVTHEVLPALRRSGSYSMAGNQPEGPALSAPQHRADQLVSAGRIFSAALRVARQMHLPPGKAMRVSAACAARHAGIEWASELDAELAAEEAEADEEFPGLVEYLAEHQEVTLAEVAEALSLGDQGNWCGLLKRVARAMRGYGWVPRKRRHNGGWATFWRPSRR